MIWRVLTLLACLVWGQAFGATKYIDPTCTNNGDGTGESCAASGGAAGAYNTWASATTWTGNAKFYQKGGTTFTGACQFLINSSGADANNQITVGSYGTGNAVMNCTSGNYAFGFSGRSFITIGTGLDITTAASNCLFLQNSTDITITGNVFRSCAALGVSFNNAASDNFDRITITDNTFISTAGSAIGSGDVPATNVALWDDFTITDNDFQSGVASGSSIAAVNFSLAAQTITIGITNTSTTATAVSTTNIKAGSSVQSTTAGIPADTVVASVTNATDFVLSKAATATNASVSASFSSAAQLRGFVITGNTFAGINTADTSPTYLVKLGRSSLFTTPTDQATCTHDGSVVGLTFANNSAFNVGSGLIYLNNATKSATYPTLAIYNNTLDTAVANVGISVFYSLGVDTYGNEVSNITPMSSQSYLDGAGIGYDFCNSGGRIFRNYIHDIPGSALGSDELNGQGIEIFASGVNGSLGGISVFGNVIVGAKKGIFLGDDVSPSIATPAHSIYNNTIIDSDLDGVETAFTVEQENTFYNNIVKGSGRYGINKGKVGSGGQLQMANNTLFSNATNYGTQTQTVDATAVNSDPGFIGGPSPTTTGGFKLTSGSALRRAGKDLNIGNIQDHGNRAFAHPPSIGAWEATAGDQATARTAATTRTARQ